MGDVIVNVDDIFVGESDTFAEFVVRLSRPATQDITVSYFTTSASASTSDYTAIFPSSSQSIVFAAGETAKTVRIPINRDTFAENPEVFFLNLFESRNQAGVSFAKSQVTATIIDNDTLANTPLLSVSGAVVDEAAGVANFVLTLSAASTAEVRMLVSTVNGSAIAGTDYNAISNQVVTFAPGQTATTISVSILNDTIEESAESFSLLISELIGASVFQNQATATIAQNDQSPSQTVIVAVDDIVVSEGSPYAEFVVRLNRPSTKDIVVSYFTESGTADTSDYEAIFSSSRQALVFAAGETSKIIRVPLELDSGVESAEVFFLNLEQPGTQVGVSFSKSQATATIIDNDTLGTTPLLSIASVVVDETAGLASFVLTLNERSNNEVTMLVSTKDGTAVAGLDYAAIINQKISFAPGQTAVTVSVPILNDTLTEPLEAFSLIVSSLTGATIFQNESIATIRQNDLAVSQSVVVSVDNIVVSEGNPFAEFIFSLNRPATKDIVVHYATRSSTASTSDHEPIFASSDRSIVFAAGEMNKSVRVPLVEDLNIENTEVFFLELFQPSNQVGVILESTRVSATIIDNDTLVSTPLLSISNVIVDEAAQIANFVLNLSARSNSEITLLVSTLDGTANAGEDYAAIVNQKVSFAPGQTSVTIGVPIVNDSLAEMSESFSLVVSNLVGASLFQNQAFASIASSDQQPSQTVIVSVDDIVVSEGSTFAEFVMRLDRPSTQNVRVDYTTSVATADSSDFELFSSVSRESVVFAAGETELTIQVPIFNDEREEPNEVFYLNLLQPTGQTGVQFAKNQVSATIVDNDNLITTPILSVSSVVVDEAARVANFNLVLNGSSNNEVTLFVSTVDGSATAGQDYVGISNQKVSFAPRQTAVTISVPILNDTISEAAESFSLVVSGLTGATLLPNDATAIIAQSDQAVSQSVVINVDDVIVSEGSPFAEFVVRLNQAATKEVVVAYSTSSSTADSSDFELFSTISQKFLVFGAGETLKTIRIPITGDLSVETPEVFLLNLAQPSNQTGVSFAKSQASATIIDNDTLVSMPLLSITNVAIDETAQVANFVLTLSGRSNTEVSMLVSTKDGSATAGLDYTALQNRKVSFEPGQTALTVSVPILNDSLRENAELFSLVITELAGATIFQNEALALIGSNDGPPVQTVLVVVDDIVVSEQSPYAEFVVRLNQPSTQLVRIDYSTQSSSASSSDFRLFSTLSGESLVFSPGETLKTIRIPLGLDQNIENSEMFFLNLSQPSGQSGVLFAKTQVTATIVDNDTLVTTPLLSISDVVIDESGVGANFVLTLNAASNSEITMLVSTKDGTALAGSDYVSIVDQKVSFAPGQTSVTISVPIINDILAEAGESFTLTVADLVGANLFKNESVATIAQSDQEPSQAVVVSVSDIVISEDSPFAEFVVTLNRPSTKDIVVGYFTDGATASSSDFELISSLSQRSLTFAAGETVKTIRVPLFGDQNIESSELFFLKLGQPSSQTGVAIANSRASATIVDNDTLTNEPLLMVSNVTVDEAAGVANFVLTLDGASPNEVTMLVSTKNGTATAGFDFTAITNQKVSFAPGQTAVTIGIPILNDTVLEIAESFSLVVSSLSGARLFQNEAFASIGDSDESVSQQVVVSIDDVVFSESSANVEFVVRLDRPASQNIRVEYFTTSATANSSDFGGLSNLSRESIVFAAGETVKTISIPIVNDLNIESFETFFLQLTQPSSQVNLVRFEKTQVSATIIDNDGLMETPQLTIRDVSVDEADGVANFVITLSGASTREVTLLASTKEGTAKAGEDFTAIVNQRISFAPGQTAVTISVPLLNDTVSEISESFSLELSNVINATIVDSTASAKIANSDVQAASQVRVLVHDIVVSENEPFAEFLIQLNRPSLQLVSLNYSLNAISASSGQDFVVSRDEVLSFAAGETQKTVRVPLIRDSVVEPSEAFTINFSIPTDQRASVLLERGFATATIIDSSLQVPIFNPTGPATIFNGSSNNDSFRGTNGNDIVSGGAGNDLLELSGGRDAFNGGSGRDTLTTGFSLSRFDFAISGTDNFDFPFVSKDDFDFKLSNIINQRTITLTDYSLGVETALTSVERIAFSDFGYAFDFLNEQSAGGVYRVYQAAFNRRPDLEGLGFWISKMDQGVSIDAIAKEFVYSAEFERVYDLKLNDDFASGQDIEKIVDTFYRNVLGRAPEKEGFDYWVEVLRLKASPLGNVLADFADGLENTIRLIGVLQDGFEYTPHLGD